MSQLQPSSETAILELLLPTLEAEGFRVLLRPAETVRPSFMQGYRPDAVALKDDRKVAIEVKAGETARNRRHIRQLQELFSGHPDWELRVVYAPPTAPDSAIATTSPQLLAQTLEQLPQLYQAAGSIPALLTGWSAFEAAARALVPDRLGRPQTPGRLLEVLAGDGYITPDEADALRSLAQMRNRAAHGDLTLLMGRNQLEALIAVTKTLLDLRAVPT